LEKRSNKFRGLYELSLIILPLNPQPGNSHKIILQNGNKKICGKIYFTTIIGGVEQRDSEYYRPFTAYNKKAQLSLTNPREAKVCQKSPMHSVARVKIDSFGKRFSRASPFSPSLL